MPTSQLCRALLHQYPSAAGFGGGPGSILHDASPPARDQNVQFGPCHPGGTSGVGQGTPKSPRLLGTGHTPTSHPILAAHVRGSPPAPHQPLLVPLTGPSFRAEPLEGSEQEKATYSLHKRRKILRLVSQWVLLYGRLLQGDRSTTALLQVPGVGRRGRGMSPGGSGCDHPILTAGHLPPTEPRGPGEPGPSPGWAGPGASTGPPAAPSVSPPGKEGRPHPKQSPALSPHAAADAHVPGS